MALNVAALTVFEAIAELSNHVQIEYLARMLHALHLLFKREDKTKASTSESVWCKI